MIMARPLVSEVDWRYKPVNILPSGINYPVEFQYEFISLYHELSESDFIGACRVVKSVIGSSMLLFWQSAKLFIATILSANVSNNTPSVAPL